VQACRVVFDGKRAVGVEVESGGDRFVVEGDQIVVSSGAIASPQLLLLSGVGPADHLREVGIPVIHELPGVGQNLRDHPSACVLFRAAGDRPDVQAAAIQVGLRYTVEDSYLRNDMQISPLLMTSEHRPAQVVIDDDENYVGISASLQLALGKGELRLKSNDPLEYPYLDYNYYQEPFDLERMRKGIRTCIEIGDHPSYRDILLERVNPVDADLTSDAALDDWLMRNSGTSHHVSGTCKMGPAGDDMAVVDQHGRIHGLENIRVADASIMPDCIRANTNATTIMIGEKVADYIRTGR
jgi:choline dehydrogenase